MNNTLMNDQSIKMDEEITNSLIKFFEGKVIYPNIHVKPFSVQNINSGVFWSVKLTLQNI